MLKAFLMLVFVFNSHFLLAQPLNEDSLKTEGRALANYKTCADIGKENQDAVMQSYYHDLYTDMSSKTKHYAEEKQTIVNNAYELGLVEFTKLNRQSLAIFCDSRLDDLTRKMQEKKLKTK
ncbi:hypothetical protein ACR30L_16010 [Psychromonas sp. PT13]|uniref:hypothetical protein n=1 Tax=Psychromonas sp. PT13 TaxID=3439547 RepID=UPI003EB9062C